MVASKQQAIQEESQEESTESVGDHQSRDTPTMHCPGGETQSSALRHDNHTVCDRVGHPH